VHLKIAIIANTTHLPRNILKLFAQKISLNANWIKKH